MTSGEEKGELKLGQDPPEKLLFFRNTQALRRILVSIILLLAIGARLVDLSDPPWILLPPVNCAP